MLDNPPRRIPADALKPETLRAVIEEFVTREGTDYGDEVFSLERKVEMVMGQLKRGTAAVEYDEESGSCTIAVVR